MLQQEMMIGAFILELVRLFKEVVLIHFIKINIVVLVEINSFLKSVYFGKKLEVYFVA